MVNVILIIDCNDCNCLFLFCFYFASQWTGWATQPVYLLCPMYVYIICNIDINLRCIVPFFSRVFYCVSVSLSTLHISLLLMFSYKCSFVVLSVIDVKNRDVFLFVFHFFLVISYSCTMYVLLELTSSWISSCLVSLFS